MEATPELVARIDRIVDRIHTALKGRHKDANNQTEPTTTLEASQDICKGSQAPQNAPTIPTPTTPTE